MTPTHGSRRYIPFITISVLLLNLLAPVGVVFAQDSNPPPEPPPGEEVMVEQQEEANETIEPEAEAEEGAAAQEEPVADEQTNEPNEPEAEEFLEVQDEPEAPAAEAGDGQLVEEPPTVEETEAQGEDANSVAEAVEALDEANAVLLDENGEPLPLASQEAADTLLAPDPQFCPAGLAFGDAGCGDAHDNMADAIADALAAAAGGTSGTIYVEAGSFDGFTISGFTYGTSLTIHGNANNAGTTNFTTGVIVDTSNNFSNLNFFDLSFDAGVVVDGMEGDLVFEDVIATNAGGTGIYVANHDGDLNLENVSSNDTGFRGIDATVTGDIDLTNVTANNNTDDGVNLDAGGSVTASNVTTNNNSDGFEVDHAVNITLTNLTANENSAEGVEIDSASGNVFINYITANDNDEQGIEIINVSGAVKLQQVSANNNASDGIDIRNVTGNVTLNQVTANDNDREGIMLSDIDGDVSLNHVTANDNDWDNIDLDGIGGAVWLNDVTAMGGFDNGFEVEADDVTITCSTFSNNGTYGFWVDSNNGELHLNSVTTGGNPGGNLIEDVANTFINQVDCNPHEGYPRDGGKVELDPDKPTTIILDQYPHSITFPPMNLAQCTGFAHSLFFPNQLPGTLPESDHFLRGLTFQLEGCPIPDGGEFTISFAIPIQEQASEFAVFFWDGTDWVEVPGSLNAEGRYEVNWPQTGVFALVTK